MKKIVLIDDNLDVLHTTKEILELANFEVRIADNGIDGVSLVKSMIPDLIICDIMMPDLDGYGVLRILSTHPETSDIPFIFLTAKTERADMRKGMTMGADDYITKPFEESELLDAIDVRFKKLEQLKRGFSGDVSAFDHFISRARQERELEDLWIDRKIKKYHKKEIIYREDDHANYAYFIIDGKVKCIGTDVYGKQMVNDFYSTGDFVGYMSLFNNGDYGETAIAMEDVELAVIPKKDFLALIHVRRDISSKFIKMLAGDIRDRERRLLQLAYTPVRERVADALLRLKGKLERSGELNARLCIPREDLANMIGTAKESLIRSLSDLKRDGFLDTHGQDILILDESGLQKIAEGH